MLVYGHRGASARLPENTIAALLGAIDDGADGVEFDVRATADGVPVLLHDRDLGRTTAGSGAVDGLTLAELRAIGTMGGEPIPTLAEALAAMGGRLRLDVELKQRGIEEAVLDLLRRQAGAEWFVSSFDWRSLRAARRIDPAARLWPLAMVCDDALLAAAAELGAPGVALAALGVDAAAAGRLREAGLQFAVWTVNDPVEARRMAGLGAAVLISDEPGPIRQALRS
jgi:glycerophosphoryl diester phosphodiesterase